MMRWQVWVLTGLLGATAQAAEVTVKISGMESEQGQLLVAVYDKADSFLDSKKALKSLTVTPAEAKVGFSIASLSDGAYAIAVIHDENGNGELDTNFIGIPKEPIGTSNNVKSRFGPPSFKDARFDLKGSQSLDIGLNRF
jgi:uncharacterized protein (DUF2141 family)